MSRNAILLFKATSFLGAFLLFGVQPMVAKMILPDWGGGANVWIAAMFFFQVSLLVGYAIAHLMCPRPKLRLAFYVVAGVAALLFLPLSTTSLIPDQWIIEWPVLSCIAALLLICGTPFVLLSTTSPSLQYMFHEIVGDDREPYFLFAMSNTGSFAALLVVPFILEPLIGNRIQTYLWSALFVVYLIGIALSLRTTADAGREREPVTPQGDPISTKQKAWIVLLSFIPSSLLLSVTHHITTDIAPVPMLWVVPLAIYLLTFVGAFSGRFKSPTGRNLIALVIFCFGSIHMTSTDLPFDLLVSVVVHLLAFAGMAWLAHIRLAEMRPHPSRLTQYFLWVSIGGALGGFFNGLIAPNLFDRPLEYTLVIALALGTLSYFAELEKPKDIIGHAWFFMLAGGVGITVWILRLPDHNIVPPPVTGIVIFVALLASFYRFPRAIPIVLVIAGLTHSVVFKKPDVKYYRSFFSSYEVFEENGIRLFKSGNTKHGTQKVGDPSKPQAYYAATKYVDAVTRGVPEKANIVILGLGIGGLCAAVPRDAKLTFIEIDPIVDVIAKKDFEYLSSFENVSTLLVDGRRGVEEMEDGSIDVLVLDAFNSDAIPVHIITKEAFAIYKKKLTPKGYVVVHASNRYLNIPREVNKIAPTVGMRSFRDRSPAPEGQIPVSLLVLAREAGDVQPLIDVGWKEQETPPGKPWTDDFASLVTAFGQ